MTGETEYWAMSGVPCCSGCFCNHDPEEMARWEKMFRESNEAAERLRAERDERAREDDAERVAALHEHLARFRR